MSDETQQEANPSPDVLAILNQDYKDVDRSMPLLAEDNYKLAVDDIKLVPSKNTPGKTNLSIKLRTMEDARDTEGKPIRAGWKLNHTISMDKTDSYDPSRNLALFRDSVLGKGAGGSFMPLDQYKDKVLMAKVVVEPESKDKKTGQVYPPKNVIKQFIPA